jgi:hemoglobin-like flavoprotein
MNVTLLRQSFDRLAPNADSLAKRFYARMFSTYPQVRSLFDGVADFAEQRRKLMASVAAVVASVDKPEALEPLLHKMGREHVEYGVQPHQYDYVRASMLAAMSDELGDEWTPEIAATWDEALRAVSDIMCSAPTES